MEIKIVKWEDKFAKDYINLSIEWLEKYVSVEPGDLDGGMIWFAIIDNIPIGTVTMIKTDNNYELAKLAVTERYKKMGVGNSLMQVAIKFAKENKAEKIYLYTNHNLTPAIYLYKKCGFIQIPLIDNKYIESDMKMELYL